MYVQLSIYSHTVLSSMAAANLFMAIVVDLLGMHGIFHLSLNKLTHAHPVLMNFNHPVLRFGKFHDERQRHCESQDHHADDDVDPWLSAAFASESKSRDLPNSHLRHTSRDFAVDNTQDIVSEYESSSVMHRATIIASSAFVGSLAGAVLGEVMMNDIRTYVCVLG